MPLTETLIGGAAGGLGGALAGESLKPITERFNAYHRVLLLCIILGALLVWFVMLPPRKRRRAP